MNKSVDAFRTISEVSEDLDIPQHVLRFWETRFPSIRPLKRGGGRRYYRPDDVELLRGIRQLLYGQGYTIKGVQRILKDSGQRFVQEIGRGEHPGPPARPLPGGTGEDGDEELEAGWDEPNPGSFGTDDGPTSDSRSMVPYSPPAPPGTGFVAPIPGPVARLPAGERARLEAARDDLLECRRILETLRRG